MIEPHGGKLVNCLIAESKAAATATKAQGLPRVAVSSGVLVDMENIARGAYSPIEGFLGERDTKSVLARGRLADDTPWAIPIVLDVDADVAKGLDGEVAITDEAGDAYAVLTVEEKFGYDKAEFAEKVYATTDDKHPGVARTNAMKDTLVAGPIRMLKLLPSQFGKYKLWPKETRVLFEGFWNVSMSVLPLSVRLKSPGFSLTCPARSNTSLICWGLKSCIETKFFFIIHRALTFNLELGSWNFLNSAF